MAIAVQFLHGINATSVSHAAPQQLGWVGTRIWEGIGPAAELKCLKGYSVPYDIVVGNKKLEERTRRQEGWSWFRHLSSQVTIKHDEALLSRKQLNIWLLMRSNE